MRNEKGYFLVGHKELVIHGLSKTRQYNTWNHMMFRCYRENDKSWKRYGGRGITVYDKWHTFEGFWDDMKEGYSDKLTLDRIDNNGSYCKENCRWTTQTQQCRNKRTTLMVFYKGKERVLKDLCDEFNVRYQMVYLRLFRYHYDIEDALTKPSLQKSY